MQLFFALIILSSLVFVLYMKQTDGPDAQKFRIYKLILLILLSRAVLILPALILGKNGVINAFSGWDGSHYLFISEHGYVKSGEEIKFIVFYPLYPMLIRLVSFVLRSSFWSGMLISNTAMVLSAVYLYKLANLDMNEEDSLYAVVMFLCFPFSFFLSGVYTESLFILLSLLCFYNARKQRFLFACTFGFFAAMTRVQGALLLLPVFYEMMTARSRKINLLVALLIPAGFFVYLTINKIVLGSWTAFLGYQRQDWHQLPSWFADNLANQTGYVLRLSDLAYQIMLPQLILFFGCALLLLAALKKGMRLSYILYSALYILMVYSASWLLSGGRYLMALFPLYIALPQLIQSRSIRLGAFVTSSILLFVYTVLFIMGKQIM